jgi:hydrogenase maturation protein HypF
MGEPRVLLTGGCFQNRVLLERAVRELRESGFEAFWPQRVPPNDGGIALGQIMAGGAQPGDSSRDKTGGLVR